MAMLITVQRNLQWCLRPAVQECPGLAGLVRLHAGAGDGGVHAGLEQPLNHRRVTGVDSVPQWRRLRATSVRSFLTRVYQIK